MNQHSTSALVHEVNLIMDHVAEHKLQNTLGISYNRFVFLYTIGQCGPASQHTIAQALKISDPAVSNMCSEAVESGVICVTTNPSHKRQRLVSLSTLGQTILEQSLTVLDNCFHNICKRAGLDETAYQKQTTRLLHSLHGEYNKIMGGDHD